MVWDGVIVKVNGKSSIIVVELVATTLPVAEFWRICTIKVSPSSISKSCTTSTPNVPVLLLIANQPACVLFEKSYWSVVLTELKL